MASTSQAKISLVIPVYNTEDFLRQCVDSVLTQSMSELEVVLVDDGSTDASGQICDEYAMRDQRIVVIHKPNGGLSEARNVGTERASGEYIMYVDADDWLALQTCERTYALAVEHDADLVLWEHVKEFAESARLAQPLYTSSRLLDDADRDALHLRLAGPLAEELARPERTDAVASAWCKLYRRAVLSNHNLVFIDTQEVGSEDILFNFGAFKYFRRIAYLREHLYHYRKDNPASLSMSHRGTLYERWVNMFTRMEELIREQELGVAFTLALNNRVCVSMMNICLTEANPKNPRSHRERIAYLQSILETERYRRAFSTLEFSYFSTPWRLFFGSCRRRMGWMVYLLGRGMWIARSLRR
jgi:glycosyltransferase EpsH